MKTKRIISAVLMMVMVLTAVFSAGSPVTMQAKAADFVNTKTIPLTENNTKAFTELMNTATEFVVVKNKAVGGSHYAYTEYTAENVLAGANDELKLESGPENDHYYKGSRMVILKLEKVGNDIKVSEKTILDSPDGFIRDPDVSTDGKRVLFSWKQSDTDDFHLYEMTLADEKYKQLTFGSGVTETEPKYLPNGNIIFSSSRIIQTVDCWHVPVSNLYFCGPNGENITRVGYDQVHTTYPTVTEDGRVLYTRWDYNDRTQMFVQSAFQMLPDGTNQTELYGNNSSFPTTLLHTREVPGRSDKYIAIASGHHTLQAGKLVWLNTNTGRNDNDAVQYVFTGNGDNPAKNEFEDGFGQSGRIYKFPYAISDQTILVSYTASGWSSGHTTPFGIYLMDATNTNTRIELVAGSTTLPASQIVPIKNRVLHDRASMVDYTSKTGTYYIGNIYEGEGLKGVEKGIAKTLRVVELEYRAYAIGATVASGEGNGNSSDPYSPVATGNGAWDVKNVLGVVPIESDGSVMFTVPALTPVYFQVLDDKGDVIQSMRSWSTLMPNETFSCVGCHEDKNSVPPATATTTIAMAKGVQKLKPDVWQTGEGYEDFDPYENTKGFSYLEEVQPILDESCVTCHSDVTESIQRTNANGVKGVAPSATGNPIIEKRSDWEFTIAAPAANWFATAFDDSNWETAAAPFGTFTTLPQAVNTVWSSQTIWMRKDFTVNKSQLANSMKFQLANTKEAVIYVNGTLIHTATDAHTSYTDVKINDEMKKALKVGQNTIAVKTTNGTGGNYIDLSLVVEETSVKNIAELVPVKAANWSYVIGKKADADPSGWNTVNFTNSWAKASAPFGDQSSSATRWATSGSNPDTNDKILMRHEFTIDDLADYQNRTLKINTLYDDNPTYYINGVKVYQHLTSDNRGNPWSLGAYVTVELNAEANMALVEGKNVLAVRCENGTGGREIDCGLTAESNGDITVLPIKSTGWKYTIAGITASDPEGWYLENFNDSSWKSDKNSFTGWGTDNQKIWVRKKFDISQDIISKINDYRMILNIIYDESPTVYLNGTAIYSAKAHTDSYKRELVSDNVRNLLKAGTNTIAIVAENTTGGSSIDVGISLNKKPANPMSLENIDVYGNRQKKDFPLSYLVLTNSVATGENFVGNSVNNITNWISSMSRASILKPYEFGAHNSNIIKMLREKHQGVELSDAKIRKIAAWIDLGVPAFGSYDENTEDWSANARKVADESENRREVYDLMDDYARLARANNGNVPGGNLSVTYTSGSTNYEKTASGYVALNVPKKLAAGDKITIRLPEGEKYLNFSLSSRTGVSLIYVPTGTYTYTVPTTVDAVYPPTLRNGTRISYIGNVIVAGIARDEDLSTRRNLALNAYDLTSGSTAFPHAVASSAYNDSDFAARNVIDGFTANKGHQGYPLQSWGATLADKNQNMKIDFGSNVYVDEVVLTTRGDFNADLTVYNAGHDGYYTGGRLVFSDGSQQTIRLKKTKEPQAIKLDKTVMTSSVTVYLDVATRPAYNADNWTGLAEMEIYGTVQRKPTGLAAVNPSGSNKSDGKITGTTDEMEWRLEGAATYTKCKGTEITGLRDGTYYIRYVATLQTAASAETKVIVGSGIWVDIPVQTDPTSTVYTIDSAAKVVKNVPLNTSLATFKSNITPSTIKVYNKNGVEVTSGNVTGGMTFKVDGSSVSYAIWIRGDVNNDGQVDILDIAAVRNVLVGSVTAPDVVARAYVNDDNQRDIADMMAVRNIILGS